MDWLNTANGIVSLIVGLVSLIGAGVSVFFLFKNLFKTMKNNTAQENWKLIMKIADQAMAEAEASLKDGESKKKMVIDCVKEGCKAAGINVDDFIDQLGAYIDDCIKFVNSVKK